MGILPQTKKFIHWLSHNKLQPEFSNSNFEKKKGFWKEIKIYLKWTLE